MKPLPTNEIATSFAPARPGTPRAFDKAKGESDAKIRSPDARSDREVKHASRTSAKDADKPIDDGEQTQTATTFDEVVNDIVDGKVETSGATMELASTQVSALSTELAALLQGIPAPSRADTAAANSADANPTTAAPEAAAQTIGDADDDKTCGATGGTRGRPQQGSRAGKRFYRSASSCRRRHWPWRSPRFCRGSARKNWLRRCRQSNGQQSKVVSDCGAGSHRRFKFDDACRWTKL